MKKIAVFIEASPWGEDLDERSLGMGLGGRETALVSLAVEWAKAGMEVLAFVPREETRHVQYGEGSVSWIPFELVIELTVAANPELFVSWENLEVIQELNKTGWNGITAIEMQVAHIRTSEKLSQIVDYMCVLSNWAATFLRTQHDFPESRIIVLPNGVDRERFTSDTTELDFDDVNYIYSSSPDRGLHHLLKMWPQIKTITRNYTGKEAILHVCYGIENYITTNMWSHRTDGERALDIKELIGQPGVFYHGKIGQLELAQIMMNCNFMLYPCDTTAPTETGCISIVEALCAGTPVVTTDCDCLGEDYGAYTYQMNLPLASEKDYDRYLEALEVALTDDDHKAVIDRGQEFVSNERTWAVIAQSWIETFNKLLVAA